MSTNGVTLLTDGFGHVENVGEESARLLCKKCNKEFTANFSLLIPEHVEYEMSADMRMTVVCPSCGARGSMTEKQAQLKAQIAELVSQRDVLREQLRDKIRQEGVKFTVDRDRFGQGFAYFNCLNCAHTFEARTGTHPDGRLNLKVEGDRFALVCPKCGQSDIIDKTNEQVRGEMVLLNRAVRDLNDRIGDLMAEYGTMEEI